MTDWLPILQAAHAQGLAVKIGKRVKCGCTQTETHYPAQRIAYFSSDRRKVVLDDLTEISLRDITQVTVEASVDGASPFVGRVGHLRYSVPETWPVTGGAE